MKTSHILIIILIATFAGFGGAKLAGKANSPGQQAKAETAYERILRTGTIRCGYFIWPPFVAKDQNSGALSGISYEMVNALAAASELKTDWAIELSFGSYLQDVASGRVDAECGDGWPNGVRGKFVLYSKPYAYVPIVAIVRMDDKRFDADADTINNEAVTVITMDGETSSFVANARAPKAKRITLPQTASSSDLILNVADGKGDVSFTDSLTAYAYIQANPGKVKMISYPQPLHLIGLGSTLPQDIRMKGMFDVATDQLLNNGIVEAILKKYEPAPGLIWRVNAVYK